jgi:hypothetical protein
MLPELANVSSKTKKFRLCRELGIFLLQCAGILTGFAIMVVISAFHHNIQLGGEGHHHHH